MSSEGLRGVAEALNLRTAGRTDALPPPSQTRTGATIRPNNEMDVGKSPFRKRATWATYVTCPFTRSSKSFPVLKCSEDLLPAATEVPVFGFCFTVGG